MYDWTMLLLKLWVIKHNFQYWRVNELLVRETRGSAFALGCSPARVDRTLTGDIVYLPWKTSR